ncbi:Ger(x)C family spore germination protein [Sedimentibacter saalensis]|jgi:Ger(x)C family germination protein|uniref:Ger(X)C family germination protein n=1 Tax=Sedimentibacter saalensis TaxID=130788 RepID=A0A562J4R0_9FIRM|nr:Ger(x)C family spore germination protein [Sedimentibacter saalensis]TWH77894.1 Ger(x)C family germination protein [Sedimentibacter saalensis]
MKKKKLIIMMLVAVATSLVLTGCWDSVEINKREYLFAVGIDKEGDTLKFTAEIPKINEGSEEQRIIYSMENNNFADFYNTSYLHSDKAISDRLMQVIVLGEETAKDPEIFKKIFDEIQRSPQMNRRVKICIAKGKAEDIINTEIPSNPIVGRFLSDMLVKLKRESYQDIYTFDEAILHLGQTGNAMIPVVEMNDKSLKIERAAVIKEYELLGFLETEEVESIMLLLNPTKANIKNINIEADEKTLALGAVDVSMTEDIDLDKDKLNVDYYITLYCYVDSFIIGDDSLADENFMNKVKEESLKKISDTTSSTIDKLQHTYKADLLRIKDDLYKFHKQDYEKIMDKYDEVFEAADINVHFKMDIKSIGLVK